MEREKLSAREALILAQSTSTTCYLSAQIDSSDNLRLKFMTIGSFTAQERSNCYLEHSSEAIRSRRIYDVNQSPRHHRRSGNLVLRDPWLASSLACLHYHPHHRILVYPSVCYPPVQLPDLLATPALP